MTNPAKPSPDMQRQLYKFAKAKREQEKWLLVARHPGLSEAAVEWALDKARSCGAEVMLREKGIACQRQIESRDLTKIFGLEKGQPD